MLGIQRYADTCRFIDRLSVNDQRLSEDLMELTRLVELGLGILDIADEDNKLISAYPADDIVRTEGGRY